MSKNLAFLIAIIILIIGAVVSYKKGYFDRDQNYLTKNVDMLGTKNNTLIKIDPRVEYFPNSKGYLAMPEKKGDYPGIVMIHENRGLRPEIKETAELLAKEGYVVLAVDLYEGKIAETQEEARAISPTFDQKTGLDNMQAAAEYLRTIGVTKIASLGWCFGGRQSIELAISGEKLDATVVYYGGNMATTQDKLKPIKWPVLGIFGGADQSIPESKVKEFENSLNNLGVENDIYVYPGVGHAFANPSGVNYAPKETLDAWDKTISFLEKHLK